MLGHWRLWWVSIPLPPAWQAGALPIELQSHRMVGVTGLEPARDFSHKHLKLACLPIPPYPGRRCDLFMYWWSHQPPTAYDKFSDIERWVNLVAGYLLSVVAWTNTQLTHGRGKNQDHRYCSAYAFILQMVGSKGLEPLHTKYQILSLARLPIPPTPHGKWKNGFTTAFFHKRKGQVP